MFKPKISNKNTKFYTKMLRLSSYLLLLMLFLTACGSDNNKMGDDEFPEFSQEELQEMMEKSPQYHAQKNKKLNKDELIKKMEELLAEDPDDLDNNYHLAKLHYQKFIKDSLVQACQKAIPYFSKVIALNPEYEKGHAYYNRMLCYLHNKQFDEALADINSFVSVNKGRTPVNYLAMRAEIFYQKGNEKEACKDYKAALVVAQKDSLPVGNEAVWETRCAD